VTTVKVRSTSFTQGMLASLQTDIVEREDIGEDMAI